MASVLWGALWCGVIAAITAPVVFGSMSNPDASDFTPVPQGLNASLSALPIAIVIGAAMGVLWWLMFHAFRRR